MRSHHGGASTSGAYSRMSKGSAFSASFPKEMPFLNLYLIWTLSLNSISFLNYRILEGEFEIRPSSNVFWREKSAVISSQGRWHSGRSRDSGRRLFISNTISPF